jgi:hypothetical protein
MARGLSFFFDYCFKTRKHCLLYIGASILACNIVAVLLILFWFRIMDLVNGKQLWCYLQLRDSP